MKDFLKYMFATVCGITFLIMLMVVMSIVSLIGFVAASSDSDTKLKDHSVYCIRLEGKLLEQVDEDPYAKVMSVLNNRKLPKRMGLNDVLRNIRVAQNDDHIDGIYLSGGSLSAGFAMCDELRQALLDFKQSGKFVVAYADHYSQENYWIASVADKVCLNANGTVAWQGLSSNVMFVTRALEKLGVQMQVVKVGTFKSAVEPYILTEMSEANRLQMSVLLEDMWNVVIGDVAQSRGLTTEQLNMYADMNMTFQPEQILVEYGLIDTLMYKQDVKTVITNLTGTDDYKLVSHKEMLSVVEKKNSAGDDKIAIIYAEGDITDDKGNGIVGTDMVKLIDKMTQKDEVKAVVLRVNSPGGSAYASEQIWHALKLLKAKKPLVVSMSDYAASGGYYISCVADSIFAEPTTLTGSIGIFGLIPNFAGLIDKLGFDVDGIGTNRMSMTDGNMLFKGMNEEEYALMQGHINRGYELFVSRCADGRKMTTDQIKEIAEGRVWSGSRAMELGLVDKMGNLNDAIRAAANLAEIEHYSVIKAETSKTKLTEALLEAYGLNDEDQELLSQYRYWKSLAQKPSVQARLPYDIHIR